MKNRWRGQEGLNRLRKIQSKVRVRIEELKSAERDIKMTRGFVSQACCDVGAEIELADTTVTKLWTGVYSGLKNLKKEFPNENLSGASSNRKLSPIPTRNVSIPAEVLDRGAEYAGAFWKSFTS